MSVKPGIFENQMLLNAAFSQDKIQGNPRSLRVVRESFDTSSEQTYVQEIAEYLPGGLVKERATYHPDGSLAYRWTHEYSDVRNTLTTRIFDGHGSDAGRTTRTRSGGMEKSVVIDSAGRDVTRTVTKLHSDGQALSSTLTGCVDNSKIRHKTKYDRHGDAIGSETVFEGPAGGFPAAPENRATTVFSARMFEGGTTQSFLTMGEGKAARRRTVVERVDLSDTNGNWTKKTILVSFGLSQPPRPIATLHRMIVYH